MGTYNIPRNTKGEGRIFFIFSTKALMWTFAFGVVGLIFYFIFSLINMNIIGIIITAFFALIGFSIGTFKVPRLGRFEKFKDVEGENLDDVLRRYIKFRKNRNKVYVCREKEETKDE